MSHTVDHAGTRSWLRVRGGSPTGTARSEFGSLGALCSAPFIAAYGFIQSYWLIACLALFHSIFDSTNAPSSQTR